MKRLHTQTICLLVTAILTLGLSQAVLAKGKPTRVEVVNADPSVAAQGEMVDVIVSGSGFDEGSDVSYLVSGTTDASQVVVESVQYLSPNELLTKIRPKDNALVTSYDIEVRAASGRKGKGTTLFRVQQKEESACTGLESKEPEIAYLTAFEAVGEYETQDLYLSSASGCDKYLLLEDAVVKVPGDILNSQHEPGAYLVGVRGLRLDIQGSHGVVMWRDKEIERDRLYALRFSISPDGSVIPGSSGPELVYVAPGGAIVLQADLRINDNDEIELLVLEGESNGIEIVESRLLAINLASMETKLLMSGDCPVRDNETRCYIPSMYFRPWWSEDGTEIFLQFDHGQDGQTALGRLVKIGSSWQPEAKILMTLDAQITITGLHQEAESTRMLTFGYLERIYHRNGRLKSRRWRMADIDPDWCTENECVPSDGNSLAVDENYTIGGWIRSGGLLFIDSGPGAQRNFRVYSDPFTGSVGQLNIRDVDGVHDTAL